MDTIPVDRQPIRVEEVARGKTRHIPDVAMHHHLNFPESGSLEALDLQ